ncbi:amino acid adenylation domain-containing protein, partial [Lysobacter maris]
MNTLESLIDALEDKGIRLALDGAGGLRIRGDKAALSSELMGSLRHHKAQLLEWLSASDGDEPDIVPVPRDGDIPASYAQQRLWFIDRLGGGSPQYNMPGAMRIEGAFDPELAERALSRIVERHEVLRTVFVASTDTPMQRIRPAGRFSLARLDMSDLPAELRDQAVRDALNADAVKPFALDRDLMLRAAYIHLGDSDGVLMFNMHHIASDGWSMGVLVREFVMLYAALSEGADDPLPPLPVQYADYAQWQRRWLSGDRMDRQLAYWERTLTGIPQVHGLPLDHPRPPQQAFTGAVHAVRVGGDVAERLRELALGAESTLFMLVHAALSAVLARYGGSEDVIIGTPVANRRRAELEPLVGFFVNTLALRTQTPLARSFREHLAVVRQVNLEAQANQDVPFEHVVERIQPQRSASHSPVFQIMLAMDAREEGEVKLPSLRMTPLFGEAVSAKFDLTFNASEGKDGIDIGIAYNRDLFHASSMERLGDLIGMALRRIVDNPDASLAELTRPGDEERERLLIEWNDTRADYPLERCIHQLIEANAARVPDAHALSFGDSALSYGELNARSNRLAHHLRALGVGQEKRVGLYLERSIDMIVAIVAVLKAGAAYVPLDPDYPGDRIAYMIQDSAPDVVLVQECLRPALPESGVPVICLDADSNAWSDRPESNLDLEMSSSSLAYIIYTSGSTGTPKGVMNEHAGVLNRLIWGRERFELGSDERILQKTPFSFDVSVCEIFLPLISGAELVVARPDGHRDPRYLAEIIERKRITATCFVPSMLQAFLDHASSAGCASIRRIWCSGEALSFALIERFREVLPSAEIHNLYGPTEAAIEALAWDCSEDIGRSVVPIGRPIANMRVYVLDPDGQPVPQSVCGEIWLAGVGVARGYRNRPELTQERFLPDPFSAIPGGRMYRTGDVGRWLPEGAVEYLGRNDFQVKIRGLRIELGEIEQQLLGIEGVTAAVVVAREDRPGQKRLVAYVAAEADDSLVARMRGHLLGRLPEYMVPTAFVCLPKLPQLSNGKVDRSVLPLPADEAATYVAPSTPTEAELAEIWASLLGRDRGDIGAQDNFFSLGGHSLLSIRLLAEIHDRLGVDMPIRAVFEASRLDELAARIDGDREPVISRPPVEVLERSSDLVPMSFAQQRLWFMDRFAGGSAHYNMPGALRVVGRFDQDATEHALRRIIERHEPLRTVYVDTADGPMQRIRGQFDWKLRRLDLSHLPVSERERGLADFLTVYAAEPFDLASDVMLRAAFVSMADDEGVLAFNMHHIASDGWSMGVLVQEFIQLFDAFVHGRGDPLPPLPVAYADYAAWQRNWLAGEVMERQLSYWEDRLADLPATHSLPLDRPRPTNQTFNGRIHRFEIGAGVLEGLKQRAHAANATLFVLLSAAFSVVLSRLSGETDIVIGTPVANRLHKELQPLVGFFVNSLVLRVDCDPDQSFDDLLRRLRASSLDAQDNQDVPFEYLVERLQPARNTSHTPLFQIVFSLTEPARMSPVSGDVRFEAWEPDALAAKFDISLDAAETSNGVVFSLLYNTDLFDASTMQRLGGSLKRLLEALSEGSTQTIGTLPLLDEAEEAELLALAGEDAGWDINLGLHRRFERVARQQPDAVAVVAGDRILSFEELDTDANRLASGLRAQGVAEGAVVAVVLPRTTNLIVAILAILKTGAAYVPVEPDYPMERKRYMVRDSGAEVVLTFEQDDRQYGQARVFNPTALEAEAVAEPSSDIGRDGLAYVLYTSGSTGTPKGVSIEHGAVVNLASNLAMATRGVVGAWGWVASVAFDASVQGLAELTSGRTLVIVDEATRRDGEALSELIRRHDIAILDATPSLLELWFSQQLDPVLPMLVVGGEPISQSLWSRVVAWRARYDRRAVNMYGPTECCVNSTSAEIAGPTPHIGRALRNVRVYVLDKSQQLVPSGGRGELWIGGSGLGRGYHGRPDLTDASFIDHPRIGTRLYRTGDVARLREDGALEYLGRCDDQVKLRGYRIEPAEIEHRIRAVDGIEAAAVVVREDVAGDRRLVAYVAGDTTVASLARQLRESLPEYMLPAAFVVLDALPMTASGKLDRAALPKPEYASEEYVAPEGEPERHMASLWAEFLQVDPDRVGANSDFFEIGGHSLLATRVISRLRESGIGLSLRDLFDRPVLRDFTAHAQRAERSVVRPLEPADRAGPLPLSFAQQRLWFIDQIDGGSHQYHLSSALRLDGDLDRAALHGAIDRLLDRHEALRTTFVAGPDGPRQRINPSAGMPLAVVDLSEIPVERQDDSIARLADEEVRSPFDLSTDMMLRVTLLVLGPHSHVLLFTQHHISSDGWSIGLVIREFSALYAALREGRTVAPEPPQLQYADYASWQREWLTGEVLDEQVGYWRDQLAGAPAVHSLPLDHARPARQGYEGRAYWHQLDAGLWRSIRAMARRENVTDFMALQTVFAVLVARYSNVRDVVIGTPIAGRDDSRLEGTVGFFINNLVLRTQFDPEASFRDVLSEQRKQVLDAYANQHLPFEMLVEALNPVRSLAYDPLFQIVFSLNNNVDEQLHLPGLEVTALRRPVSSAKVDLEVVAIESGDDLAIGWTYRTGIFEESTVARLAEGFERLLEAVVDDAGRQVFDYPLLTEREASGAMRAGRGVDSPYDARPVQQQIAEQAQRTPASPAVVCGDVTLSYAELEARSNRLA